MVHLANNLQRLRKHKGRSQEEVAGALGISRSSYSGYELGTAEPKLELLQRMGDYHGLGLDVLIGTRLWDLDRLQLHTTLSSHPPRHPHPHINRI